MIALIFVKPIVEKNIENRARTGRKEGARPLSLFAGEMGEFHSIYLLAEGGRHVLQK